MFQKKPPHLWLKVFLILLISGFLGFLVIKGTVCPIRRLTGFPCPACGMSRAWIAVFHGDFKKAFYYHPLFWIVPFFILYILWDGEIFSNKKINFIIAIGLVSAVGLCWIIRLVMYFCGNLPI